MLIQYQIHSSVIQRKIFFLKESFTNSKNQKKLSFFLKDPLPTRKIRNSCESEKSETAVKLKKNFGILYQLTNSAKMHTQTF